jgi:hypothetical protein
MKLPVDTSAIAFLCAVEAEPVVDFETKRPGPTRTASRCTWSS